MGLTDIFFDIKTYSPDESPHFDDEVIAIAYQIETDPVEVLECWKLGEKEAISQFFEVIQSQPYPALIGHSILRFDIPILANRASANGLGTQTATMETLLQNTYPIDLIQLLLPSNNFRFKGLKMENCSRRLGYIHATCKGSEIASLYEGKEYKQIVDHIREDVEANVRLYKGIKDGSFFKTHI